MQVISTYTYYGNQYLLTHNTVKVLYTKCMRAQYRSFSCIRVYTCTTLKGCFIYSDTSPSENRTRSHIELLLAYNPLVGNVFETFLTQGRYDDLQACISEQGTLVPFPGKAVLAEALS